MNILIYGIGGKMGKVVYQELKADPRAKAVAGVDKYALSKDFDIPVYSSINEVKENIDCIIDFSVKDAVSEILEFAVKKNLPVVLATTGYDKAQLELIRQASKNIPVFFTGNMSLGVNVLCDLVKKASSALGEKADIEIIEAHHNQKVDAPSGTAKMLLNAAMSGKENPKPIYGREGIVGKRQKNEIGVHAVRGGSIVGKHEVMFIMNGEVITLKHEAESKSVFALGSINAAIFLKDQLPGLYDMNNYFNS